MKESNEILRAERGEIRTRDLDCVAVDGGGELMEDIEGNRSAVVRRVRSF
jgi:hypothetical protein